VGQGDVLMSIGEAKRVHKATKQLVMIVDRHNRPVRSDLFDGIRYLTTKPLKVPYKRIVNAPGVRPYIAAKTDERWTWRPYQPEPADVVFTPKELAFAEPYRGMVMVEPNVKSIGHRNKDWGWANWWKLDALARFEGLVQCTRDGDRLLPNAKHVPTNTFRQTLAVLSVCKAFVGTEGGLMHGAAAVGTPAVVIFGGFISPDITGYKHHRNIFTGGKACGMRHDCDHCRKAMNKITPALVLAELKEILK
jgi:Glycosyltransferase family 9 (heptosyltransferase)